MEPDGDRREAFGQAGQEVAVQQRIARRAYEIWRRRGCLTGSTLRDWLDAEAELASMTAVAPGPESVIQRLRELEADLRRHRADRRRIEALRIAELELADSLENAVVALHWVAADGTVLWANRADLRLLGYDRDEYVGRNIAEFHVDRGVIEDILARLGRDESLSNVEARLRHKDGSVRHVLINSNVLWRDGEFVHTRCFTIDVTERRRLEATLRASECWNRAILDSAVDAIVVMDHQGCVADLNRAAEAMFGYSRQAALGRELAELVVPPAVRGAHRGGFERYLRTGEGPLLGTRREVSALRADGTEFPAEVTVTRIPGSDPPRFTSFVRDVSERKAVESRLTQLADLCEASDEAIVGCTPDGTVIYWNRGAEQIYGYSAAETVGRSIGVIHPPDRPDELAGILEKAGRGESVRRRETVRVRKDGRRIDVSLTVSPVRDPGGAVVGLSAVGRDITDRKTAERNRAAEHAVVRALAESGSLAEAREKILDALCDILGWDFGAIWEAESDLGVLCCTCTRQRPGAEVPEFDRRSRELSLPTGVGLPGRVWASGGPAWLTFPSEDPNFPRREAAASDGLLSAFAFPIADRDQFLGVVEFLSRDARGPDPGLMETMAHVGAQIAQFVERRMAEELLHGRRRELEVAREIQQGLLPKSPPALPGFEIASAFQPAHETGGDLFDFLRLADGRVGIVVGDASGHGLGAALVISATRAYLRAFAADEPDPGRLLARANRCLAEDFCDGFVTLFLAWLDPAARSLTYANAGHWPGYVIGGGGEVKAELKGTGIPLGLDAEAEFSTSRHARLDPGDRLFLLTDGVVEAMSPENDLFGVGRVLDLIGRHSDGSPGVALDALSERLEEFTRGRFLDDRTAVLLKVLEADGGPHAAGTAGAG